MSLLMLYVVVMLGFCMEFGIRLRLVVVVILRIIVFGVRGFFFLRILKKELMGCLMGLVIVMLWIFLFVVVIRVWVNFLFLFIRGI